MAHFSTGLQHGSARKSVIIDMITSPRKDRVGGSLSAVRSISPIFLSSAMAQNAPSFSQSAGRCEAAVFSNTTKEGREWHNTQVSVSHKDKEGEWQRQRISLTQQELLSAIHVLARARTYIDAREHREDRDAPEDGFQVGARMGKVRASVFRNLHDGRASFSTTLQRSYEQDGEEKTQDIILFEGDLLNAAHAAEKALEYVDQHEGRYRPKTS